VKKAGPKSVPAFFALLSVLRMAGPAIGNPQHKSLK